MKLYNAKDIELTRRLEVSLHIQQFGVRYISKDCRNDNIEVSEIVTDIEKKADDTNELSDEVSIQ